MHKPSPSELQALAADYDIEIHDDERAAIHDLVHTLLENLDQVRDVPVAGRNRTDDHRFWDEPTENPHNAIITTCDVSYDDPTGELLEGMDVGIKDVISVRNVPMTGGSNLLRGHVPSTDATIVERLLSEGATITAKTNCDELATSGRGTTSAFGWISNPNDQSRTAGGSSGGSAVTVATGMTDIALGTDTSGSVQLPAALCGIIGLKPTYGLIPLSGVIEHAYTMDHVSFFATNVSQLARILEAGAGVDQTDPATLHAAGHETYRDEGYLQAVQDPPPIADLSIGIVSEGLGGDVTDYVIENVESAISELESQGASIQHVSIEHFRYARPINENISYTELVSHWMAEGSPHRRGGVISEWFQVSIANAMAGASGQLGHYYKSKLLAGAQLIEAHQSRFYTRAQAAREKLRAEFEDALEDVDVLLYPSVPAIAPKFEEVARTDLDFACNTRQATVTRLPAITLPYGEHRGLPTSIQLVDTQFEEAELLAIARSVREALDQTARSN